ncbi:MAG: TonB-dependent receptor [Caulobacteraceae bacterium]|nr:TonB-dependent receptor [Caulobacteraceae bacterium]
MNSETWARLGLSTAMTLVLGAPALAAAPSQGAGAPAQIEEVVVTAERRETKLQDTPISITALTSSMVSDAGIKRVEDFANMLPNVYIDDRNLRGQNIAIRGISADLNNPGLDQGVGIFIDGVYLGRATSGNSNLFGLERVEVLRGPQGTLYGKNTIAGAINYITRKPGDVVEAEGDISYGNYSAVTGDAMVSGPIVPGRLFASLGGSFDERAGLIKNLLTGTKLDNRNGQSGRFQLLAKPTDDLELILRADVSRDRTHSGASEVVTNGALPATVPHQPAPTTRTVAQNRDPVQDRDAGGVSAEINWATSAGTLTSLTAYRLSDWHNLADNDFTAADFLASGIKEDQTQVSQEVRFASKTGGPFDYIVGAYYFHQDLNTDSTAIAGADLGVYPSAVNADIYALLHTDSYAAFAHGEYHVNDQWSLVGGLRYTREDKKVTQSQVGDPYGLLLTTQPSRTLSRSEGAVSPTISVNYKPTADLLYYATFSQGYKSGGFNVFSIVTPYVSPASNAEYAPEHVNNYEVGFKSEFLEHRVRLDASAYYMDYRNLQANELVLVGGLPQFQTSNAAKARSEGVEVQLDVRPTREVTLSATYGYDEATFVSYKGATSTGADYTGHTLPRAPKNNASASAQWDHPLSDNLSLFTRVDVSYRSKIYFASDNALTQGALTLVNARVGLESPSGRWGVYLWGRNLGDVNYAIDKEHGVIISGQVTEALAAPRTFGVEIRARY